MLTRYMPLLDEDSVFFLDIKREHFLNFINIIDIHPVFIIDMGGDMMFIKNLAFGLLYSAGGVGSDSKAFVVVLFKVIGFVSSQIDEIEL